MEKDIMELLEINTHMYISGTLICKLLGIKNTGQLRKHINALRLKGEPIISSCEGYKIADNCGEFINCLESLRKRSDKFNAAIEGMDSRIEFEPKKIMR